MATVWKGVMREDEVRAVLARALGRDGRTLWGHDPITGEYWVVSPRGWARGYMEAGVWGYGLDAFRGGVVAESDVPMSAILAVLVRAAGVDTEAALEELAQEKEVAP